MATPESYPVSVEQVLDDSMPFEPDVLRCVRHFAQARPAELSVVEQELADLRGKSATVLAKGRDGDSIVSRAVALKERGTMNHQAQTLFAFLQANPGVWYSASTLRFKCPEVGYQVSLLLKGYIDEGRIARLDEHRGCEYSLASESASNMDVCEIIGPQIAMNDLDDFAVGRRSVA
jgi:hypothetical protein